MFHYNFYTMQPHPYFFGIIFLLCLASCYTEPIPGPVGPPGYDGRDGAPGEPGPQTIGLLYEIEFTLNADNEWSLLYEFPPVDEIYVEDVVLVYLLQGQQEEPDGTFRDVWRLMPISYFTDAGLLQLNYDFSVSDVSIFADAAFPLDPARDVFANEVARIVVVPANFSPNAANGRGGTLDYRDYEAVMSALRK